MMREDIAVQQMIEEWKQEYKQVFCIELNEYEFYFRLLTHEEYTTLGKISQSIEELDEFIAKCCVLDPEIEDWHSEIYAGFVTSVANAIKEESLLQEKPDGQNNVRTIIEEERNKLSRLLHQIPPTVAHVFPKYSPEDVRKLNLREQTKLYAEALWVLEEIKGVVFTYDDD